jgi:hypothetical protein
MTNLYTEAEFNSAVSELKYFMAVMSMKCTDRGWSYYVTDDAPEKFKDLKARTVGKRIPIASYGSDTTIYGEGKLGAEFNHMFRFWHDVTHLELDQGFSKDGERAVIEQHLAEGRAFGLSELAIKILEADTLGQVEYYFKHRKFVENQRAFIDSCVQHGIRLACGFEH